MVLILTPDIANQVRGLTVKGHALAPRLLTNGNFALPEDVLTDPAHAIHADFLRANTTVIPDDAITTIRPPIEGGDFVMPSISGVLAYEIDTRKTAPYIFSTDWPEGQIIVVP